MTRKVFFTDDQLRAAVALGLSQTQIARRLRVSHSTVHYHRQRLGLELKSGTSNKPRSGAARAALMADAEATNRRMKMEGRM